MKHLTKYWKKIPSRHYFPIFVFVSLFFVVNELIVFSLILVYVLAENQIKNIISKLVDRYQNLVWLAAICFFLVMIDDTLLYFFIIAFIIWDVRKKNKQKNIQKTISK